ncbi:MAG: hypothetical protein HQK63_17650, partial [Desulfamplus sp.]|nr:hypothetical protein [Desulfamplus sp.]
QALTLQKQALKWIDIAEQHRNYGYLAQIYTAMGAFDKAEESLEHARELIDRIQDISTKTKQLDFYHWIESEYLYRRVACLKRKPGKYHDRFSSLCRQYENITHFSHGLTNKFCGLGMIIFKEPEAGLQLLNKAEDYFDAQIDPMMALLGVTVRIEKVFAWCDVKSPFNQNIVDEIEKVINALSVQKNIREFFYKDIKILQKSLSGRRESLRDCYPASGEISEAWQPVLKILHAINHRIPY